MSATRNNRSAVLEIIGGLTDTCAPVRLTIGRKFNDHFIIVHEAAPRVVSRLVAECQYVSMTTEGLHIPTMP